jgi:hypothetical protein
MNIAIISMIIFALIWYWRVKQKQLLVQKFKFDLKNLRNELRWRSINSQLNNESWIYEFLDNKIQIASDNLTYFNIYSTFEWDFMSRKDNKLNNFRVHYDEELSEGEKLSFREFDKKLSGLSLDFIIKKHGLIRFVLFILGKDKK